MFQDITTLLLDTEAFKDTIDIFVERYKGKGISVVAGTLTLSYPILNLRLCLFPISLSICPLMNGES